MYIGCTVWLMFLLHQFRTVTATHTGTPGLQGYENLIPYSDLYEACIDENLSHCAVFLHDDVVKRSPQFNAWGGKRAKFSSWGGKRGAQQFNSWGGKRASDDEDVYIDDDDLDSLEKRAKFSSWGGKRQILEEKRAKFNSWGGKRDILEEKRAKFNSWGGKRVSKFSSWGGKRSPEVFDSIKRAEYALGYKRKPAFNSWGGKRSEMTLAEEDDHIINKRETEEKEADDDAHMPDLWKEFFDRISNPNFNKNNPYDQVEISTIATPVKKSYDESHLQQLFKQFVYWTGNQPGEKKNMIMNSRLLKERYSMPMRRGSDFYAWGGKRSGDKSVQ